MKKLSLLLMIFMIGFTGIAFSQIREIPKAVEETFSNQYKGATNIDYDDQLVKVDIHFQLDGDTLVATYSNKGAWKETVKQSSFEKLPAEVQDGFAKSKYAEKRVDETIMLYLPGGSEQYRVKIKINSIEKRYIYFNDKGRLLREAKAI